jgi:Tol biopolymer transport system component
MKKILNTLFLICGLYYNTNAQNSNPKNQKDIVTTSTEYKIGVAYGSSLFSNMEKYEFVLNGGEKIELNAANPVVYFTQKLKTGQSYSITQVSGPRSCNMSGANTGTISNSDVLVSVNCGNPPLTIYKLNVMGIEAGEIFSFADNYGRRYQYPFSTTANLGGYPRGDHYAITQTGGPRQCIITPATGTVTETALTIQCDCRKTTGTDPTSSSPAKLKGNFTSPPGTRVVLRLSNTDSLVLTQPANANNVWLQTMNFSFPKNYPAGTAYAVSIRSAPANLGCIINENGAGTISENGPLIDVRCDKKIYDLVSRSTDNKILSTYYESFNPVIGGKGEDEGRYVAFGAYGKGMDGGSGNYRQIFWRDRKTGVTKLISKTASGAEANGNCQMPAIAADGKTVAFESYATNLSANDNNGARDIYVWSQTTGTVTLVSKAEQGGSANGESLEPTVSGDGSVIAYTSNASNIVTLQPVFSTPNIYVYEQGGATTFISKDYETGKAVGGCSVPSISEDGTKIAFCGYTSRLVKGDNNNLWDIFLWQSGAAGLKRISLTSSGAERNQGAESASRVVAPSISGDGNYVAFATTATNMVPGDNNNAQDVFVVNVETGNVIRASVDATGKEADGDCPIGQGEKIAISYDGKCTAFTTVAKNLGVPQHNIVMHNSGTGQTKAVTAISGSSVGAAAMSAKGNYIVFGMGSKLDTKFASTGIFATYTAVGGSGVGQ